ncbi:MAG TPA: hypothetical protein VN328_02750 [Thermodesulfovibrionales bacterium]|nr:hypothetical protein [Thermodesulfovibrionales bacterium]
MRKRGRKKKLILDKGTFVLEYMVPFVLAMAFGLCLWLIYTYWGVLK